MLDIGDIFPLTTPEQERLRLLRTGSSSIPSGVVPAPNQQPRFDTSRLRQQAADAAERGMGILDAAPDLTQWQDYAKRRSDEGGRALVMALAAQQAGKEFQPLAGQMLQKALSARDPMQVGKAGMITPDGEFMADPFYQREKQADLFLRRAETLEKVAQSAETAEERMRAAEEARKAREAYQQQVLGLQQQGIDIRRDAAAAAAARAGDAAEARAERARLAQEGSDAKRVDGIRREYNARLQKVQEGAGFAGSVLQTLAMPDISKNAPAQISLVMQFGKMLDPDSVVREAEQQMIMKARGILDSWGITPDRIAQGVFLTPKQLAQMRQIAAEYERATGQRVNDLKSHYAGLAQRNKLPVEDIVLGYSPTPAASPVPAGAVREKGAPAGAVREVTR